MPSRKLILAWPLILLPQCAGIIYVLWLIAGQIGYQLRHGGYFVQGCIGISLETTLPMFFVAGAAFAVTIQFMRFSIWARYAHLLLTIGFCALAYSIHALVEDTSDFQLFLIALVPAVFSLTASGLSFSIYRACFDPSIPGPSSSL